MNVIRFCSGTRKKDPLPTAPNNCARGCRVLSIEQIANIWNICQQVLADAGVADGRNLDPSLRTAGDVLHA
jgi:hypothetical protein